MSVLPTEMSQDWGYEGVFSSLTYGKTLNLTYKSDITIMVSYSETSDSEPYDGLERTNVGYVDMPARYTWSMNVPVTAYVVRLLRGLQKNRLPFHLTLETKESTNTPKNKLGFEQLKYCKITSAEKNYRVGELPVITINGKALIMDIDDGNANGTPLGADFGNNEVKTSAQITASFGKNQSGGDFWT